MNRVLNEEELQDLYAWIDKIPLSRPKRHITRDFSDGVMAAEVVRHFFPKLVDLHNYVPANSTQQKISNWSLLNRKVFSKLNFVVPEETVRRIVLNSSGVIEPVLRALREKIEIKLEHSTDNILICNDLQYYDHKNQDKLQSEIHQNEAKLLSQLQGGEMKTEERAKPKSDKLQHTAQFYSNMDPASRLVVQDLEKDVMALMEKVEIAEEVNPGSGRKVSEYTERHSFSGWQILQMKVDRLEQLVHLKDVRINDLNRRLDAYRGKGNAH